MQIELPEFKFRRKHTKDVFYKYVSINTLKLILEKETLRHSSPLLFNDPFDCQAGLHCDFDVDNFIKLFFKRVEQLVISEKVPVFADFNRYSQTTMLMRKALPTHGFPKDRVIRDMGPIIRAIADMLFETRQAALENWKATVRDMRVLCLSEQFDNIMMWSHYADNHQGAVIELKVAENEHEDDTLWIAQPVKYIKDSIPLFGIDVIDGILGITEFPQYPGIDIYAYAKYDIWEHEKEWRVFTLSKENELYKDYSFKLNKISKVIFGCRCNDENILCISKLIDVKKLDTEFIRAKKHEYDYRLEFEKIP
jgi:hypothetical protein